MKRYSVELTPEAQDDLADLRSVLLPYGKAYALRIHDRIFARMGQLREYPHLGPVYPYLPDYRRLVADDWLILYRVDEEAQVVRIVRILYGRADVETQMETDVDA